MKTIDLYGLMPDEEYQYCAYISMGNEDVATGTTKSFTTKTPIANITDEVQTNITSATVGYGFENVPDGGSCQLILLKVGDPLQNAHFISVPNTSNGNYTFTGLEESTSYQYMARIEYKTRKWDSSSGGFTTKQSFKVYTIGHSDVTDTSVTLKGKIEGDFPEDTQDGWGGFYINTTGFPQASNARLFRASARRGEGNSSQAVDGYMWADDGYFYGYPDNLTPETQYYYRAVVIIDGVEYLADEVKTFTTEEEREVDLGLSVNWAAWNIGASNPAEYGAYFSWGETEDKWLYGSSDYEYYNSDGTCVDLGNISGTQYDAAKIWWGDDWRMPTRAELEELCSKCTFKVVNKTINVFSHSTGLEVTGPSGKSIYLPFGGRAGYTVADVEFYVLDDAGVYRLNEQGHYWSSENGDYMLLSKNSHYVSSTRLRHIGRNIRAVKNKRSQ